MKMKMTVTKGQNTKEKQKDVARIVWLVASRYLLTATCFQLHTGLYAVYIPVLTLPMTQVCCERIFSQLRSLRRDCEIHGLSKILWTTWWWNLTDDGLTKCKTSAQYSAGVRTVVSLQNYSSYKHYDISNWNIRYELRWSLRVNDKCLLVVLRMSTEVWLHLNVLLFPNSCKNCNCLM